MKFYRENQVNPFASCLPMIAQLPVFLVALLHAAERPAARHLPGRSTRPGSPNPVPCGETPASSFLFIPDLTDKATGAVLVALIVLYVGSQLVSTLLMSGHRRQEPAADLPGAAVLLRRVHLAVPGRPARVLDHDEPVDDRAAVDHQEAPRAAARTGHGRREGGQGGAGALGQGQEGGKGKERRKSGGGRALGKLSPTAAAATAAAAKAAARPAPGTAAQEEEALGAAPMTARRRDRVRELLEQVIDALDLDAERRGRAVGEESIIRASSTPTTSALFIGRHGTTIDAVQHLAYKIAGAADDGPAREHRRRRLPRAPRAGARAPGRRGRRATRSAPAARSRWTR